MKKFEIHITGEKGINEELTAMNIKNIIVELLHPNYSLFRTEYMSSFIKGFENLTECQFFVHALVSQLKTNIVRVKIESPYYEEYAKNSLYIESHFTPFNNLYPISRNQKSGNLMATDREYNPKKYQEFIEKWIDKDVELCLYDSCVTEDFNWFELYKIQK